MPARGRTYVTSAAIANTDDDPLYQSERYGNFSYSIPLANGSYTVTLKFAEIAHNAAGRRVFHVDIEGNRVLENFDIFVAAGGKNIAVDRSFPVTLTDGTLNIVFTTVVDNAKISAIEVVPSGTTTPTASFTYRGDGLRHSATIGSTTTTSTWDLNSTLPVILQDGTNTYVYGHGLISQTDGAGNQTYFLSDGLGSTRALTDDSGNAVATVDDALGMARSNVDQRVACRRHQLNWPRGAAARPVALVFGFGRERPAETALTPPRCRRTSWRSSPRWRHPARRRRLRSPRRSAGSAGRRPP